MEENLLGAGLQTLRAHISQHCVANKPASTDTHRKLYDVARGRRRLYAPGDKAHPSRANGKVAPSKQEIPAKYHHLVDWFTDEYVKHAQLAISMERGPAESRFEGLLTRLRRLTPEERKERAREAIRAVIAFERRRSK